MSLASSEPDEGNQLPELNPGDVNACKFEWINDAPMFFPCPQGKCFPLDQQKIYAEFLLTELMTHLHHDHKWRVVLADPVKQKYDRDSGLFRSYVPTKIECQFVDHDEDAQFVVTLEQSIDKIITEWGLNPVLDQCERAYEMWADMMKVVDVREDQMYRAAKGETPDNVAEQWAVD